MAGVRLIEQREKRILLIDLANTRPEEALVLIGEAKALAASQPPKSLLTITSVQGMELNPKTAMAMEDLAIHNEPFVVLGIVTGVTGIRKAVFDAIVRHTHRRLMAFENMEQAKTWLREHVRDADRVVGSR